MNELIKKYVILHIVTKILTYLIPIILLTIFPKLLTTDLPDGGSSSFGIGYLETIMRYLLNIIIIAFIYRDMEKLNLKSLAVLILTFFSSLTGTIFFLFLLFEKQNITKNEKRITETIN
jgi:hypothetical protein